MYEHVGACCPLKVPKRLRANLHRSELSATKRSRSGTPTWIASIKPYRGSTVTRRNFSEQWIVGADSVRTSNVKDHAQSDQHAPTMMLLRKEQGRVAGLGVAIIITIKKCSRFY